MSSVEGRLAPHSTARVAAVKEVVASSTLHGDEDTYGAQFLLDGLVDTCWNSDGGAAQTLTFTLAECATLSALELVFQGGFVGQDMLVEGCPAAGGGGAPPLALGRFQPEDSNSSQTFALDAAAGPVRSVTVAFHGSTDFYGRVVLYSAAFRLHQD